MLVDDAGAVSSSARPKWLAPIFFALIALLVVGALGASVSGEALQEPLPAVELTR